jgi:hypothetical protein
VTEGVSADTEDREILEDEIVGVFGLFIEIERRLGSG